MNEHYKKALVAAAIAALAASEIEATEEEVITILDNDVDATGTFEEDLEDLIEACELRAEEEEDDEFDYENEVDSEPQEQCPLERMANCKDHVEKNIDEIVGSLKIGYNFIPGIGAGWCRNEEDLEKMRDFVRGALTAATMMGCCMKG